MRKLFAVLTLGAMTPLASARADVPASGSWQAACPVIAPYVVPAGPCSALNTDIAGFAYWINPNGTATIWSHAPIEDSNFEFLYRTQFYLNGLDPAFARLFLSVVRQDDYFTQWSFHEDESTTESEGPGSGPPEPDPDGEGGPVPLVGDDGFTATPEPATMLLLATGLAGLGLVQWRRRKA